MSQFIRFRYISKVVEWIKNKWQWEGNPLNAQCVICLYKIINILRNNSKDSGIMGYVFSRIPLHIKFPYKSRNLSLLKQRKNPSWTNPSNLCNRNLCARQFYSKILSVFKTKAQPQKKIADRNFQAQCQFFHSAFSKKCRDCQQAEVFRFCGCKPPFERASFFSKQRIKADFRQTKARI